MKTKKELVKEALVDAYELGKEEERKKMAKALRKLMKKEFQWDGDGTGARWETVRLEIIEDFINNYLKDTGKC